jgi:hypothetical protein
MRAPPVVRPRRAPAAQGVKQMHRTTRWTSLAALGLLAASGCGGNDAADPDAAAEDAAAAPAADETVFDDLVETQERARAVEDLNDQRREQLESALESEEDAAR